MGEGLTLPVTGFKFQVISIPRSRLQTIAMDYQPSTIDYYTSFKFQAPGYISSKFQVADNPYGLSTIDYRLL